MRLAGTRKGICLSAQDWTDDYLLVRLMDAAVYILVVCVDNFSLSLSLSLSFILTRY